TDRDRRRSVRADRGVGATLRRLLRRTGAVAFPIPAVPGVASVRLTPVRDDERRCNEPELGRRWWWRLGGASAGRWRRYSGTAARWWWIRASGTAARWWWIRASGTAARRGWIWSASGRRRIRSASGRRRAPGWRLRAASSWLPAGLHAHGDRRCGRVG